MKIILVVNNGYEAGGAEKSVRLLKEYLTVSGHRVLVVSTNKNANSPTFFADQVIPVIQGSLIIKVIKRCWNRSSYMQLKAIVQSFQPDIVHIHTMSEFSPSIFWIGRTVPTVFTIHGPEEFIKPLLPWLLPATDYEGQSYQRKDLKLRGRIRIMYYLSVQRPIYRWGIKHIRCIITPSRFMEGVIKTELPCIPIRHIYNGIILHPFKLRPASNLQTVVYAGRLEAVKGVEVLLRALSAINREPDRCRLVIIGDGAQKQYLQELSKELKLDNQVDFKGWLDEQMLRNELQHAAFLVIPSVWPENLPTIGIEALASAQPIIGSNIGGIPELIENDTSGKIIEPNNVVSLANAIIQLLDNPELRAKMSRRALVIAQEFDARIFIEKVDKLYRSLIP